MGLRGFGLFLRPDIGNRGMLGTVRLAGNGATPAEMEIGVGRVPERPHAYRTSKIEHEVLVEPAHPTSTIEQPPSTRTRRLKSMGALVDAAIAIRQWVGISPPMLFDERSPDRREVETRAMGAGHRPAG